MRGHKRSQNYFGSSGQCRPDADRLRHAFFQGDNPLRLLLR